MKSRVKTIIDFTEKFNTQLGKHFAGFRKVSDYEMPDYEFTFGMNFSSKYQFGYVQVLQDLKDNLGEHVSIDYDSQSIMNESGKARAQIRLFPEYYCPLVINLISKGGERKISLQLESEDAYQLLKMQTKYEFTLKELSKRNFLDTLLKIMKEYLIRKEDWT